MQIVNLTQSRERYCDIELLKVDGGSVFFAVQVSEGEKYFYAIKKYDIGTKKEDTIWRHEIEADMFYSQKAYMSESKIIIVNLEEKDQVGVEVLDSVNGELIREERICISDIESDEVLFINDRYFLVSGDNAKQENVYYLCDIEDRASYMVTIMKFISGLPAGHGLMRKLPCFKRQGEEWIVFNECYMEDYEYEQIYDCIIAKNFGAEQIRECEGIYVIPLNLLVEGIKQKEDIIPFKEIKKRWVNGWVRYLGIKNGNIYYREKDFETQIETVYRVDIERLEESVECQINHQQLEGVLRYDLDQIYEDIRGDGKRSIKGHYGLGETLEIPLHKRLRFETYLENRYIITSWWWENEVDGNYEYKEFVGIQDTLGADDEKQMRVYEGQCYIQDGILLIY